MLAVVRDFVDHEGRPVVNELEHITGTRLIEQMKNLGIFGLAIPEGTTAHR